MDRTSNETECTSGIRLIWTSHDGGCHGEGVASLEAGNVEVPIALCKPSEANSSCGGDDKPDYRDEPGPAGIFGELGPRLKIKISE